ncbi:hypothetical protein KO504_11595 [Winogradskyella psychrotolerans]|uniref:hypothetical protein n=1 Tax=Winogradskyella psychrotolerans TaxID=1344585 RepID=UPI001C076DCD|nr:hypothetical protein [Winogradskyella psychrotolerans]MBU2921987.1 hypothetical protein [Winogradskyella psychrotolerans]
MTFKYLYISFISLLLLTSTIVVNTIENDATYTLLTTKREFIAGESITLRFAFTGDPEILLYGSNSYGSILLEPEVNDQELTFVLPRVISNKSGVFNWQLQTTSHPISGHITIHPKSKIEAIESYLGPPSVEAGGTDYTMLVVIPTDDLDNPLADNTSVTIKHQFLTNTYASDVITKNGFAYKNIYSETKKGRMLISSACLDLNSKEFDVNVMPAIPTNFKIASERIHDYADGNQITTFKTSVIKDRYDNIISDGTFVTFFITNTAGYKSKTSGTTINGIASAKMLHPDFEDQWSIKAYVEGMANSDTIVLNYKQAISDFEVAFSEDNRTLTLGPIQSFMNQRVPDGLTIKLSIYKDGMLVHQPTKDTFNGMAEFYLDKDRYPKGVYDVELKTAGIVKSYKTINL